MKLIENWRCAYRFLSVRLMAVAMFVSLIPAETFLILYNLAPDDIQFLLPGRTVIVVACLALAFVARIVKQPKLAKPNE